MSKFQENMTVRLKNNAYPLSTDPKDIAQRGQIGIISQIWHDGEIIVELMNGQIAYVTADEIELLND